MVDKINDLINLIKENILKLDDITINETIYILKDQVVCFRTTWSFIIFTLLR